MIFYKIKHKLKFYTITYISSCQYFNSLNTYKSILSEEHIFANNEIEAINIFLVIKPEYENNLVKIVNNRTNKEIKLKEYQD